jgi:oligosaccharide repeat unit polymerase
MIHSVIKPKLILEFPYFMGAIFFIFIVPQAIIIFNQQYLVPRGVIAPLYIMCFLCLLMVVVGYYFAPEIRVAKFLNFKLDEKKATQIGIVYTVIGCFFYFLIWRTYAAFDDAGVEAPTQATGIVTIYFLFYQLINIAFPLFLYLALRNPKQKYILFAFLACFPNLYQIIVSGRRETTALFVLSVAYAVFYRYKLVPPRAAIVAVIVLTMLIIPATSDYRSVADKEGSLVALQTLDLQESFQKYFNEGGKYLELGVAARIIDNYSFSGEFAYGATYWDQIIFRYVPAQIVGKDVKRGLMLESGGVKFRNGYQMPLGLTATAMGDTFWQFGYLGCIFFFFMGGFFRNLWRATLQNDNPLIQILYTLCVVNALISVTHGTINFIPAGMFGFGCLFILAQYAKVEA